MFSDAELYSRNHTLQSKDANYLMDYVLPEMSFGEDDVVMDIGCGSGETTRDVFLSRMPKTKKLIAIDVLPAMIEYASVYTPHEKIEYYVANAENKHSMEHWEGSISKVVSLHCFHWMKNQKMGFQNIYDLLKCKGDVAMAFTLSSTMWASYPSLLRNKKWNAYLKEADQCVAESHYLNLGPSYYRKLLESLGFEVLLCFEEIRIHTHGTDEEFKDVLKTISAFTSYIPDELREEFANDLFMAVLELSGRNSEGLPNFPVKTLVLHARKL